MSEKKTGHPYLDHENEEHLHNDPLWNSNADLPVYPLVEKELTAQPPIKSNDESFQQEKSIESPHPVEESQESVPEGSGNVEMLSSFAQWLMSMKPASVGGKPASHEFLTNPASRSITLEKSEGRQKDKKKKKKKKKEAKAEERRSSPAKEQGIVSETLAELLSGQGHKEEAIEMYHNLMIRYPEKAGYYLQKINDLRR